MEGIQLRAELLAREVDHLNWAKGVSNYLLGANIKKLHVGSGHRNWSYGEGRKHAEALLLRLKTNSTRLMSRTVSFMNPPGSDLMDDDFEKSGVLPWV